MNIASMESFIIRNTVHIWGRSGFIMGAYVMPMPDWFRRHGLPVPTKTQKRYPVLLMNEAGFFSLTKSTNPKKNLAWGHFIAENRGRYNPDFIRRVYNILKNPRKYYKENP